MSGRLLGITIALLCVAVPKVSSEPREASELAVRNAEGLRVSVDWKDADPELRVAVPDGPGTGGAFDILFPEHVTVRAHGQHDAVHLYLFEPGLHASAPRWNRRGNSLEYTAELGPVQFTARAMVQEDGILFRYEFQNRSQTPYDFVTAITDPRFNQVFFDPRLERTWVHTRGGFILLGSDWPERLTLPLSTWLPTRVHASYTAPVPGERVQHRADGITYRYLSRRVDVPMVATLSTDHNWVAASFARSPGNVWSNPELTCQHVDPDVQLAPGGHAFYEVKLLIFRGSLEAALEKVRVQRAALH